MHSAENKPSPVAVLYAYLRRVLLVLIAAGQLCFLVSLLLSLTPSYCGYIFDEQKFAVRMQENKHQLSDFKMDYALGLMMVSPERENLYDPAAQDAWFKKAYGPDFFLGHICYAPFFFLLMIPLSQLNMQTAFAIWTVTSTIWAVVMLLLLGRFAGKRLIQSSAIIVGALASFPAWNCIALGQTSWFYVGFFSAAVMLFWRRREFLNGILLCVVAIKPHYAVLMSIPCLLRRRWKTIGLAAVLAVLLCAAAAQYLGWMNILKYPYYVATTTSSPALEAAYHTKWVISVRGPLTIMLPWKVATAISSLCTLGGFVLIGFIWHQARNADIKVYGWAWALTIVIGITTSAHTHLYDCLLFSVAAMLTMPTLNLERILQLSGIPLRVWSLILYFYPAVSVIIWITEQRVFGGFTPVPHVIAHLALCLSGYLCFRTLLNSAQAQGEPPEPQAEPPAT